MVSKSVTFKESPKKTISSEEKNQLSKYCRSSKLSRALRGVLSTAARVICGARQCEESSQDGTDIASRCEVRTDLDGNVPYNRSNANVEILPFSTAGTDVAVEFSSSEGTDAMEVSFDSFSFGLVLPKRATIPAAECKFFPDPVLYIVPHDKGGVAQISETCELISIASHDITSEATLVPETKLKNGYTNSQYDISNDIMTSHISVKNSVRQGRNSKSVINVSLHRRDDIALDCTADECDESLTLTIENNRRRSSTHSAVSLLSNSMSQSMKMNQTGKAGEVTMTPLSQEEQRPSVVLLSAPIKYNTDVPTWVTQTHTEVTVLARLVCGKWETIVAESEPLDPMLRACGINYFKRLFMDKTAVPLTVSVEDGSMLHVVVHTPIGNRKMRWGLDGEETSENDPDCGIWKGTVAVDVFHVPSQNGGEGFRAMRQRRVHDTIGVVFETCAVLPHPKFGKALYLHYALTPHGSLKPTTSALRVLKPIL